MSENRHTFNFDGGDTLTTLGACWFVSYSYYKYIDSTHLNWKFVTTYRNRQSVYNRSQPYHKYWFTEILKMNEANLNKNHLNINGYDIKRMAKEILAEL